MTSENPPPGGPRTPEDWLHAAGEAATFFTCLPLGQRAPRFRVADILPAWPVVGLAIGVAGGIDLAVARWLGAAPWLAAVVGLLTGVVLTAALHEDGLADTADAFGASGVDRARRLEILRDSRIGTYGALALVFSLLLRLAALAQVAVVAGTGPALLALGAAHAVSRAAMVWPILCTMPARADGLGASLGRPAAGSIGWTLVIGGGIAFVALLGVSALAAIAAPPLALALAAGMTTMARARIGGYTGDTLGATQQVVEIAVLVLVALCVGGGG
ncbi:adenosylcobinamide-GDP ribazoletransferase [Vineibacter terrae]|uniref:Adenosylcobinamide-GDP ribazoletransferase n=1 Tax=Vineibacter terrae TaxID=2586908 RepID=A0A5C8PI90_9HYPH|nr:adenosylcobinamide-GDP ribazoletransferase [Vineibacter terrae]TXL73055.1 adenosylcobinamide-GDP ribazoletransferase [Vineibacter terrae]